MRGCATSVAVFCAVSLFGGAASAVKIAPLPSKELLKKSAIVLIGKVTTAKDNTGPGGEAAKGQMYVSVSVGAILKGRTSATAFSLALDYGATRKSFDPKLRPGQVCVFFLSAIEEGEARLAHWGSVAPFEGGDYLYRP